MGYYSKKILRLMEKNLYKYQDITGYSNEYIERYMRQFYNECSK